MTLINTRLRPIWPNAVNISGNVPRTPQTSTLTVELTAPCTLTGGPSAPAPQNHQVTPTKASSRHLPLRPADAHAWPGMSCPGRVGPSTGPSPARGEPEPRTAERPLRGRTTISQLLWLPGQRPSRSPRLTGQHSPRPHDGAHPALVLQMTCWSLHAKTRCTSLCSFSPTPPRTLPPPAGPPPASEALAGLPGPRAGRA